MRKFIFFCALFVLSAAVRAQSPQFFFYATLKGAEETPAVPSNGTGLLTLTFSADLDTIRVSGMLLNLEGALTGLALHAGARGEDGPVLLDLAPMVASRKIEGKIPATPDLAARLFQNKVYVSARTSAFPDGEIRGQLVPETDLNWSGAFSSDQMIPAVSSNARGLGAIHFPVGSEEIILLANTDGLSSPIRRIAIYRGAPNENGTLIIDTPNTLPGSLAIKKIYFYDLEPNFLNRLIGEEYYVVLKTDSFPDGEARAHFRFMGFLNAVYSPSGFQNVPPNDLLGAGMGFATLNPNLDSMYARVLLRDISPTAVRVRKAAAGANGPVIATLSPGGVPGTYEGDFSITPDDLRDFVDKKFYLEAASADYPDGALRGQMETSLRKGYAFDLCGAQAVPPNNSAGLGMAMLSVDQVDCYLNYKVILADLSGDLSGALLAPGAPGETGPFWYNLSLDTFPLLEGITGIDPPEGEYLETDRAYIQINTPDFPNGEIRGQVRRQFSCPLISSTWTPPVSELTIYPNPAPEIAFARMRATLPGDYRLSLRDAVGRVVREYPLSIHPGEQTHSLDLRGLPAGYYIYALKTASTGQVAAAGRILKK